MSTTTAGDASTEMEEQGLTGSSGVNQGEEMKEDPDKSLLAQCLTPEQQIIPELVEAMRSNTPQIQFDAAKKIHRSMQLLGRPAEIGARVVINSGLLPTIISSLSSEDVDLVSESTLILVNVSAGTSDQTSAIVDGGGIPKLIAVFRTAPDAVKVRALTILGNIVADSGRLREIVIREGGLEPALEVLGDPERYPQKFFDTAAWTVERATGPDENGRILSNMGRPVLPILLKFIQLNSNDNTEAMSCAVKALRQVGSNQEGVNTIINSQMTSRLVQLCVTGNQGLQEDALRILSRFTAGRKENVQAALEDGILDALQHCIGIRIQVGTACWAAGNLARGTVSQVTALVNSPLISLIVGVAFDDTISLASRQEAAKALSFAARVASSFPQLLEPLAEARCIEALSEMLSLDDGRVGRFVLHGIKFFTTTEWSGRKLAIGRLKACDGIRRLRDVRLKAWARQDVSEMIAQGLLRTHFPEFSKYPRV
ncbi:Importin alpha subunit (Karyopherin alpha subunit) (Serine-rich RNA polymerase I suppressor protein) [Tulasnella sp. 424]|nr:Importin alpha subunit (Karyopherin alpha subunit) (Serine-rich RNA polymerase I suppressor protein) [Tulasnella sp. 424]KAG8970177.1 Importin alpha subunit (Karyopherin alpha subunit) (Serine-rich RNA polymerase I suppressor protein) [Tulasnella sp. 425]